MNSANKGPQWCMVHREMPGMPDGQSSPAHHLLGDSTLPQAHEMIALLLFDDSSSSSTTLWGVVSLSKKICPARLDGAKKKCSKLNRRPKSLIRLYFYLVII